MKTIMVDINEKEMEELGITSDHISSDEFEKKFLIRSIRRQREELEKLNKEYGFDKLTEEEIFEEVNKAKAEYYVEKNHK